MRDINEDLLKHRFNEELAFVATRFASLLRDMGGRLMDMGLREFTFENISVRRNGSSPV